MATLTATHATSGETTSGDVGALAGATALGFAAKTRIGGLLGLRLRFMLSDKRIVVGTFQCMDRHSNFIVSDAFAFGVLHALSLCVHNGLFPLRRLETRPFPTIKDGAEMIEVRRRTLGSVLVPGKHLVKVETMQADWDDTERTGPSTKANRLASLSI